MVRSRVPACLVWVVWLLMALRWWGMGSSTLLGPEGSAGLRSRVGEPPLTGGGASACGWGWCWLLLVLPLFLMSVCSGRLRGFVPVGVSGVGVGGVGGVVV